MKKILGSHFKWFILFFALGAGSTLALGYLIQFHAVSNDFWNILYYGRNMTFAEPESLYNGFFPFGYAFLVGQLPFTYVLPLAYVLNALLTGLFTASVSTLISYARSVPATILAFFCSMAAPFVFQNANTLSPDIGSAAFTAFAVFLLWREYFDCNPNELSDVNSAFVGLSLGLAFLWRTHAIVAAIAIFLGYFLLLGIRPIRSRVWMVSSFLTIVALQVVVNLWSGHGFFETAQAFNIYKFFYGVDMTDPPTPVEMEGFSILGTILNDPMHTFDLYIIPFKFLAFYAWTSAAGFLLSPKGRFSKYFLFSVLYVLLYAVPVSLGDSARAPLLLMGAFTSSLSLLLVVLSEQAEKMVISKWTRGVVILLFIVANAQTFYRWVRQDVEFIRVGFVERRSLEIIEQTLLIHGMKSPSEIFADRYDFYTPNTMPYRSRQIGNWSEGWVWGFAGEFPTLPNDSWESFAAACKEQGVRFLLLSPNSFYRSDFFPKIYDGEVDLSPLGLRFIAQRGNIRIYEFR